VNVRGRGRYKRHAGTPYTTFLVHYVPRPTWNTLKARQRADSLKLGRDITIQEIVRDLVRQYAQGLTYFGKSHPGTTPPLELLPPLGKRRTVESRAALALGTERHSG
jgi:hypothetical protein